MMRWIALLLLPAALLSFVACGDEEAEEATPTATAEVEAATDTGLPPERTDAAAPQPTDTPPPPEPTRPPLTNRQDCDAIRGTSYLSPEERGWFLDLCITPQPIAPPQLPPPGLDAPQPPPPRTGYEIDDCLNSGGWPEVTSNPFTVVCGPPPPTSAPIPPDYTPPVRGRPFVTEEECLRSGGFIDGFNCVWP